MRNFLLGWFTTFIGLVIIAGAINNYFGWVKAPDPGLASKPVEVVIAFVVGLGLMYLPTSRIESFFQNGLNDFATWVKALVKKKLS